MVLLPDACFFFEALPVSHHLYTSFVDVGAAEYLHTLGSYSCRCWLSFSCLCNVGILLVAASFFFNAIGVTSSYHQIQNASVLTVDSEYLDTWIILTLSCICFSLFGISLDGLDFSFLLRAWHLLIPSRIHTTYCT
jgi:hypothetical protein